MNTAEKLRTGAIECACGRFYETMTGVTLCQENDHGSGKDRGFHPYQFKQSIEIEYGAECADCGVPIKFRIVRDTESRTILIHPHVCQIDTEGNG